jgi:hypothetical protein
MFHWVAKKQPLLTYLDGYLSEPQWVHAAYVVPLLAWRMEEGDAQVSSEIPDGAVSHLIWSLRAWSAFRDAGSLQAKIDRFRSNLPNMVGSMRELLRLAVLKSWCSQREKWSEHLFTI